MSAKVKYCIHVLRVTSFILLVSAGLSSLSCGTRDPEILEEEAGPQKVVLHLTSVQDLNSYNGVPASLLLCVYQLKDSEAFDNLLDDAEGFARLLSGDNFDSAVVGRERCFINPGESRNFTLDRRKGAQFLALVGGYHNSAPRRCAVIVQLPQVRPTKLKWRSRPPVVNVLLESNTLRLADR